MDGKTVTGGFSGFGWLGKRADAAAGEAAKAFLVYHHSGVPVGRVSARGRGKQ